MSRRRLMFGLIVLGFGVILLMRNLNLISLSFGEIIGQFWPLILIGWGISLIVERGSGAKLVGLVIFLLGLVFLSRNLGWLALDFGMIWRLFWPAILILLGIRFLLGPSDQTKFAFLGGIDRTNGPWELKNHSYWAVLGGIEMDIRNATFTDSEIQLSLTSVLGGIEVIVPPDIAVICDGTCFLGGLEFLDKHSGGIVARLHGEQSCPESGRMLLRLNCLSLLGGVEVKTEPRG